MTKVDWGAKEVSRINRKELETALWDFRADMEYELEKEGVEIDVRITVDQFFNKYLGSLTEDIREGEFDEKEDSDGVG